jgi:hypothetical protein
MICRNIRNGRERLLRWETSTEDIGAQKVILRLMMRSIDAGWHGLSPAFLQTISQCEQLRKSPNHWVSTNTETPPTSRWSCQVDRYVPQCIGLTEVKA